MRSWSVRNARWLEVVYGGFELVLRTINPVFRLIGYKRLDKLFVAVEKIIKVSLFDSQSCGQCILSVTGMSCPMNCPKKIRNGPCGGVHVDGTCEVDPHMPCVWVLAWEGNKRLRVDEYPIQIVQPPVDHRLLGTSAWMHMLQRETQPISSQTTANNEV